MSSSSNNDSTKNEGELRKAFNAERKALIAERRKRFLEKLIQESIINVLAEQQPAPAAPPAAPPAPPTVEPADPNAAPQGEQPFNVDDMIERLNVIRGGRSFTDPEVYGQLVSYFKTLDEGSKEQMKSFLVELGKIVIDVNQEEPTAQPQQTNAQPPAPPPAPATAPAAPPPAAPPAG